MDSLSKDEMEIIRVEKKIQKLKNKYETDKSELRSKILDIKNIHCRIPKEKFKEITTSAKFRRFMRLSKKELVQEVLKKNQNLVRDDMMKLPKKELVFILFKFNDTDKIPKKRGRKGNVYRKPENPANIEYLNESISKELGTMGFESTGIKSERDSLNFQRIFSCWGAGRFIIFFRTFILFWYSNNGWNGCSLGAEVAQHFSESQKNKLLNRLPLSSFKFESFCKSVISTNKSLREFEKITIIKDRGTRKGFCGNIGCDPKICTFIFKYNVYYSSKYEQFKYGLSVKGQHDKNFTIGKSKLNYLSFDTKSILNDGVLDSLTTTALLRLNRDFREGKQNIHNKNEYILTPEIIKNKRYRNKLKNNGTYKTTFDKAVKSFKVRSFKHLRLIFYDEKNLSLTFLVYCKELFSKFKNINQIYIDGTFKTKFLGNAHYCVLVFAVNIPGCLRTIPLAFTISFRGRSIEYGLTWKSFKRVIGKKICLDYCSLISDLGSSERKFAKIEESLVILKYTLCWFHTFIKCFLPKIKRCQNKNLIPHIKRVLRIIYS
jgi:hypothetical protein